MAKGMTKSQVVAHLAEKAGVQKKAAAAVLEEIANLATREYRTSGQFVIPGLGKGVKANRKERMGGSPGLDGFDQMSFELGAVVANSKAIARKLAEINQSSAAFWKDYRKAPGTR